MGFLDSLKRLFTGSSDDPSEKLDPNETKLIAWCREDGHAVKEGESLFEVVTDKMTAEIPSSDTGTLRIYVPAGQIVAVGEVIGAIDVGNDVLKTVSVPQLSEFHKRSSAVIMPKMGDGMMSGKVMSWKRENGDRVKDGDIIVEIETDKSNVEVLASQSGILRIKVAEGETIPIGAVIATIS